jgi:hypothetical protein
MELRTPDSRLWIEALATSSMAIFDLLRKSGVRVLSRNNQRRIKDVWLISPRCGGSKLAVAGSQGKELAIDNLFLFRHKKN